ncbi:hypothetical protein [Pseudomonas phage D6]|nr:hypothetical protein [Pseudomonas phage D6]
MTSPLDVDDYEPTEAEEWAAADAHLTKLYQEEQTKLFGSFAVNQSLKEKGIMQDISQKLDIMAASEATAITQEQLRAFESAKDALGGDEVVTDSLSDVVAATQTPVKPLTKKQAKMQKRLQQQMRGYIKNAQRQAQTSHIMNKLYAHSIRTPQQARQIHAAQLAKAELVSLLGQRQAEAFFAAKSETKCHDFFPKATVEANPTLMTDAQGQSRTLEQVYEYYIYKHYMILTEAAGEIQDQELNLQVEWDKTKVEDYVAYEGADEPAGEAVEEESTKAA